MIWVAVLALVINLVVAYNVRYLRKTKDAVSKIADGDFSVRISRYKNDEVGEICAGVNDMAEHLEKFFRDKNRNERFYYKFVPEKFRELLDKEQFTDLALGDAVSKDLTIMFCDIRAFSLNSEMMTVRESFEFVNHIYGVAGPVIREHNGFVDKYIGDAVMALFESADDAVAAGIELYKKIVSDTELSNLFGIENVNIGIGIHSGMSQIGIVGEEERMSGTVISDVVNLSSRLESLTKQYETAMLISKDTLDRMENPDILHTRYLGMVQVAGVNEVVALYEVLDCMEESGRQNREINSREFREAVRLFHMGKLEPALSKFEKISQTAGNDKVPAMYAGYLRGKLETGDFSHNVFQFKNK
jgi:class 3 adenylate cyclase